MRISHESSLLYKYKLKVNDLKLIDCLKCFVEPCDQSFYNFDWKTRKGNKIKNSMMVSIVLARHQFTRPSPPFLVQEPNRWAKLNKLIVKKNCQIRFIQLARYK